MMTHCVVPGVSQYKCRECGWELMITETDHAPQDATGGSDESAEWCTGYRHRPWPPRGCDRCGGEMRPWQEAKISRRRSTRSTFYSCPGCGREKVNRDDPCPRCHGHPRPDPNPPQVWCADCGWEPPFDLPIPGSRVSSCHRCGSDRIHWQGGMPIAYCRQCHAIINSREEYCTKCWQAWQTIDVWDPSDEGDSTRTAPQEELPLHLDACHGCALRVVGIDDDGSELSEGYLDKRRQAYHRINPQAEVRRGLNTHGGLRGLNELSGEECPLCGPDSRRRVRKSSWAHPESHTWDNTGRSSWSGWQTWGDTDRSSWSGWLYRGAEAEVMMRGTETEAMLRQPENWGAIPPPTSLEAGVYRAENYYPHGHDPARAMQLPQNWQPQSSGPSSGSGSQAAEAAPPTPAAPVAAPGPLDSSGR